MTTKITIRDNGSIRVEENKPVGSRFGQHHSVGVAVGRPVVVPQERHLEGCEVFQPRQGEEPVHVLVCGEDDPFQPAETPYRATHAIFVIEGAENTYQRVNEIPDVMRTRLLSLRAYNAVGMMLDADVVDGRDVESLVMRLFRSPDVAYYSRA